ncbi:MAG: hypothetical protein C5B57_01715 [Blastocatellia bacterium]|nr:MAG: hypothetical protein C5B57_01715 [Blastocatellia bacterium]
MTVPVQPSAATTALVYPAEATPAGAALILAHGAGGDQRSSFMVTFAKALSALGLDILTFNFLYTEQRRRVPDRTPLLETCYRAVIDVAAREIDRGRGSLFIGGKSMGGRIATHVAAADSRLPVRGVVLLGYPLHPPGRPAERRDAHLPAVGQPMLFIQGSRDPFGAPAEFDGLLETLAPRADLHVVDGGDHSFKVRKEQAAVDRAIQQRIAEWVKRVLSQREN